jgi:hypothetical protein
MQAGYGAAKDPGSMVPRVWDFPKATPVAPQEARGRGPGAVGGPVHAWKHLAREPGDPVTVLGKMALGAAVGSPRTQSADERAREV